MGTAQDRQSLSTLFNVICDSVKGNTLRILNASNVPPLLFPDVLHFLSQDRHPEQVSSIGQRQEKSLDRLYSLLDFSNAPATVSSKLLGCHSSLCCSHRRTGHSSAAKLHTLGF